MCLLDMGIRWVESVVLSLSYPICGYLGINGILLRAQARGEAHIIEV